MVEICFLESSKTRLKSTLRKLVDETAKNVCSVFEQNNFQTSILKIIHSLGAYIL